MVDVKEEEFGFGTRILKKMPMLKTAHEYEGQETFSQTNECSKTDSLVCSFAEEEVKSLELEIVVN